MQLPADLKFSDLPREARPCCRPPTRSGGKCQAQALRTGKCFVHSGLRAVEHLPKETKAATIQRLRRARYSQARRRDDAVQRKGTL
jgi:hypothetical protein